MIGGCRLLITSVTRSRWCTGRAASVPCALRAESDRVTMPEITTVYCPACGADVRSPRGLLYHGPQCRATPERRLIECEEALRSTEREYAAFREQTLAPIKREHASIESTSWNELLGVAVRNLNHALRLDAALREILTYGTVVEMHSAAERALAETGMEQPDA